MKNSRSIFTVLAITLMFAFAGSTIQSITAKDTHSVECSMSIGAVIAPLAFFSMKPQSPKKSHWRKSGPMICMVITQPQQMQTASSVVTAGPQYTQNPTIQGILPGERVIRNDTGNNMIAMSANSGIAAPTDAIFADFSIGRVLSYQFTFADTYAGGVVPLLPQYASDTLPTGVTLTSGSSPFATYAAMVNFYTKFPTVFNKLVITVDDTANFDKTLTLTKTKADGNTEAVSTTWNRIALDPYAQVQTVRTIAKRFVSGADVRYEIKGVVPGSGLTKVMTFSFDIEGQANTFIIRRPEF